ncbi:hypothetical protein C8J56DRAFT_886101 [Mycena floridula]|nr:hypothetical protein C8J56DRAFT_886101 [Mycena floridula]
MFGVIRLLSYFTLATIAFAIPVHQRLPQKRSSIGNLISVTQLTPFSLNNWGGFNSLSSFDNFFGADNFNGFSNVQNILEQELICGLNGSGESLSVDIVQQQLAILAQIAQMAILTQLCEVEVQQLALQQFLGGLSGFSNDLLRLNGAQPSFDSAIAGLGSSLFDDAGALNTVFNFNGANGFGGLDIGNSLQLVSSNWNDEFSPQSVANALAIAEIAALSSSNNQFGNGFDIGNLNFSNAFGSSSNGINSNSNINVNNNVSSNINTNGQNSSSNNNQNNNSNTNDNESLSQVAAANGSSD